jgi:hypothetical protein
MRCHARGLAVEVLVCCEADFRMAHQYQRHAALVAGIDVFLCQ